MNVEVEFNFFKGCRGCRDSLGGVRGAGPPLEPDDPPEIEIVSVLTENGQEIELTDSEQESIEEKCWEMVADRENDYPDREDY